MRRAGLVLLLLLLAGCNAPPQPADEGEARLIVVDVTYEIAMHDGKTVPLENGPACEEGTYDAAQGSVVAYADPKVGFPKWVAVSRWTPQNASRPNETALGHGFYAFGIPRYTTEVAIHGLVGGGDIFGIRFDGHDILLANDRLAPGAHWSFDVEYDAHGPDFLATIVEHVTVTNVGPVDLELEMPSTTCPDSG